jgi:hypothetical protein
LFAVGVCAGISIVGGTAIIRKAAVMLAEIYLTFIGVSTS